MYTYTYIHTYIYIHIYVYVYPDTIVQHHTNLPPATTLGKIAFFLTFVLILRLHAPISICTHTHTHTHVPLEEIVFFFFEDLSVLLPLHSRQFLPLHIVATSLNFHSSRHPPPSSTTSLHIYNYCLPALLKDIFVYILLFYSYFSGVWFTLAFLPTLNIHFLFNFWTPTHTSEPHTLVRPHTPGTYDLIH